MVPYILPFQGAHKGISFQGEFLSPVVCPTSWNFDFQYLLRPCRVPWHDWNGILVLCCIYRPMNIWSECNWRTRQLFQNLEVHESNLPITNQVAQYKHRIPLYLLSSNSRKLLDPSQSLYLPPEWKVLRQKLNRRLDKSGTCVVRYLSQSVW